MNGCLAVALMSGEIVGEIVWHFNFFNNLHEAARKPNKTQTDETIKSWQNRARSISHVFLWQCISFYLISVADYKYLQEDDGTDMDH